MGATEYMLLIVVGLVGGFLNTVAGGASLLTLPVLIFLGIPPTQANATNNVATTAQSLLAAIRHAERGYTDWWLVARLSLPAVLGGAVGALIVVSMTDAVFRQVIAVVMVGALLVVARPRVSPGVGGGLGKFSLAAGLLGVALLAVYGGFFGGGVGLLLLPLIAGLFGRDLLTANGVKCALTFAMNVTAAGIFLWNDMIHWLPAGVLTAAMLVGAWIGVDAAIERGEAWIRRVLVVVTLSAAGWLALGP